MSSTWFFFSGVLLLSVNAVSQSSSPEHAFKECLVSQPQGTFGYCLGYSALTKLHSFDNSREFDLVDGLTFVRDDKLYRNGYGVVSDSDPSDYRSILDSWAQVFQRRTMRWDMAFVYPGLAMRMAPAGTLDFVMDQHHPYQQHALKELTTGRLLARQFLVPLLLGFKFNITTLIPIVFGLIAIIAKKAVVLGKIALLISSAFGLGSLLFPRPPVHPYGYQPTYNPSFGGHFRVPHDEDGDAFKSNNIGADASIDQLRLLYDTDLQQQTFRHDAKETQNEGRNFAWSDDDADKTKTTTTTTTTTH